MSHNWKAYPYYTSIEAITGRDFRRQGRNSMAPAVCHFISCKLKIVRSAIGHQNKGPGTHKNHQIPEQLAKTRSSRRTVGPDSRKHHQQSATAVISDN
ncbi:hypothetical protein BCV71DRAFT_289146 [Rhizopus microsporus]|uniref:Uncharacterized protein n=1 Tax=Rhizopus microsporus TaxID=58291 RepID=A0A1X0S9Z9_RHIZD|nr:hypothetical protein BCV71DRAFT_289146 [Rhizopus microsporus]